MRQIGNSLKRGKYDDREKEATEEQMAQTYLCMIGGLLHTPSKGKRD